MPFPIHQSLSGPIKEWPREHREFFPVLLSFKKRLAVRRESESRVVIKDKERGALLDTVRDIALHYLQ